MKGFAHPETTKTWDLLYYQDHLAQRFYDLAVGRMLDLLAVTPDNTVLDAGCGAGVHSLRAAQRGCRVVGVDFSAAALEDAAARVREAGVADRVTLTQGDLTELDIPDDAYSKIFCWGVLIHIPEIERAMNELSRVLAPGGRLAIYIGNSGSLQLWAQRCKHRLFSAPGVLRSLPLGLVREVDLHGDRIWVWHSDVRAVIRYLEARGLRLIAREPGEFSDLGLHFKGPLKRLFQRINNAWVRFRLPARLAQMNLLVFEK